MESMQHSSKWMHPCGLMPGCIQACCEVVVRGSAPSITNIACGAWPPPSQLLCVARPSPSPTLSCGARPPPSSTLFSSMRHYHNFTNNNLFAHLHTHICDFGMSGSPRQNSKTKIRGKPLQIFFLRANAPYQSLPHPIYTSSTNYPTLSPTSTFLALFLSRSYSNTFALYPHKPSS